MNGRQTENLSRLILAVLACLGIALLLSLR